MLTPHHSWLPAREGWDKQMIQQHIHARAQHEVPMVRDRRLVLVHPPQLRNKHSMPVTRFFDDIAVVVAGGRSGHSAVLLPWALRSEAIVEPVLLEDGSVPLSIEDFRR